MKIGFQENKGLPMQQFYYKLKAPSHKTNNISQKAKISLYNIALIPTHIWHQIHKKFAFENKN